MVITGSTTQIHNPPSKKISAGQMGGGGGGDSPENIFNLHMMSG